MFLPYRTHYHDVSEHPDGAVNWYLRRAEIYENKLTSNYTTGTPVVVSATTANLSMISLSAYSRNAKIGIFIIKPQCRRIGGVEIRRSWLRR